MPEVPIPDKLTESVPQLVVMVLVVSAVLAFALRLLIRQAEQMGAVLQRMADRHEAAVTRHEAAEERQFAAVALQTAAIEAQTKSNEHQTKTLDVLARTVERLANHVDRAETRPHTHEIRTMSATNENEPLHIGVPGGEFSPDVTYSAQFLAQNGDRLPWTIPRYGIDALHRAGVTGKGAVVVVVDTGVQGNHPDLNANLDLGRSRSFTGEPLNDVNGHGTHCSGIVCADNNSLGTIGVAPDSVVINCKGLSDSGSGSGQQLGAAIRYAADLPGHKIFSLSFGSTAEDPQISGAIRHAIQKGHWVVAAAGNAGPNSVNWPGAMAEVVCVAALDNQDRVANFSSTNDFVDVAWGGVGILSTIPGGRYAEYSGTSMATPGVAGVLALAVGELVKAGKPIPNQQAMTAALYATCRDLGTPGRDNGVGHGLVQARAFIDRLVNSSGGPTPPPGGKVHRVTVPKDVTEIVITLA